LIINVTNLHEFYKKEKIIQRSGSLCQ